MDSTTVADVENLYPATKRMNGIPSESFEVKVTGMSCTINARQTSTINTDGIFDLLKNGFSRGSIKCLYFFFVSFFVNLQKAAVDISSVSGKHTK